MKDDKVTTALPAKPPGPLASAVEYGFFGAAFGALFGAIFSRFGGRPGQSIAPRVVDSAVDTALFSGVLGYFMGERNVAEHKLTVENIQLKDALMEEKKKSFVQHLQQEITHEQTPGL